MSSDTSILAVGPGPSVSTDGSPSPYFLSFTVKNGAEANRVKNCINDICSDCSHSTEYSLKSVISHENLHMDILGTNRGEECTLNLATTQNPNPLSILVVHDEENAKQLILHGLVHAHVPGTTPYISLETAIDAGYRQYCDVARDYTAMMNERAGIERER